MHQRCKFGENMSYTFQDIVLTMLRTHTQSHEQQQNFMTPATLGLAEA